MHHTTHDAAHVLTVLGAPLVCGDSRRLDKYRGSRAAHSSHRPSHLRLCSLSRVLRTIRRSVYTHKPYVYHQKEWREALGVLFMVVYDPDYSGASEVIFFSGCYAIGCSAIIEITSQ